jgi:hypothetical protein
VARAARDSALFSPVHGKNIHIYVGNSVDNLRATNFFWWLVFWARHGDGRDVNRGNQQGLGEMSGLLTFSSG